MTGKNRSDIMAKTPRIMYDLTSNGKENAGKNNSRHFMSIMSIRPILKAAAPVPKIEEMERFLFLGPHPDDIEIGAGATAARLATEGKSVCFLICMDGRYGTDNWKDQETTPLQLAEMRKEEAMASAASIGVTDVRFLELEDGGFYSREKLFRGIAACIADFRPDVLFAPDPDVDCECHPDHRNVGEAAKTLALFSGNEGIMRKLGAEEAAVQALAFYMTAKPNRYMDTTGFLDSQLKAVFAYHRTQFPEKGKDARAITLYLKLRAYDYGIRSFHKTAEGFRVLGRTQMHCFPEGSR